MRRLPSALTIEALSRQNLDMNTAFKSEKPNATGKPHRSAKRAGNPQVELVGVGLTDTLGWGEKDWRMSPNARCLVD